MRRFAIQQIDELLSEMKSDDAGARPPRAALLPSSKTTPVRPPLKYGASKLAAKRKPTEKKAKKRPPKSGQGQDQGGQE